MSLSRNDIVDYAGLLDDLDFSNKGTRILAVLEILRNLTDEEHCLSNADIRAIIAERFGPANVPSENTLNADLKAIATIKVDGLKLHRLPKGNWMEREGLPATSVRTLHHAFKSFRFLTDVGSETEIALLSLLSEHHRDRVEREQASKKVIVNRRTTKEAQQVLNNCDLILDALQTGKKIEFVYNYFDFDGIPHELLDNGESLRVETPIALIFAEGNYYLESYAKTPWRGYDNTTRSRVDRMTQVAVSRKHAEDNSEVKRARATVDARVQRSIQMFGGTPRTIFLKVRADKTNEMFDTFGFDLAYDLLEGTPQDKDSTKITCIEVGETATFFRWLAGTQGGVQIVKPSTTYLSKSAWSDLTRGKSLSLLEEDYESMRRAFKEYLMASLALFDDEV